MARDVDVDGNDGDDVSGPPEILGLCTRFRIRGYVCTALVADHSRDF